MSINLPISENMALNLPKPARKIPITNRSVSGIVPSIGRYESSLERDLMELLRFDSDVESVLPQPMTISFVDASGSPRQYTPDGLIRFNAKANLLPVLYEVKFREDFRENWREHLAKFRAAKALCLEKGWRFEVFTEREIRTTYLKNIKFLWPYKNRQVTEGDVQRILTVLSDLEVADPDFLLHAIYRDQTNRARLIPTIWHLIARNYIACDLDEPLTMNSRIWCVGDIDENN